MALNDAVLNIGADAMADVALFAAIHTALPNAAGSNPSTAARESIPWAAATGGDLSITAPIEFTGGAASGPATYVGFWSAVSAGTFYGFLALTGDQTFNAAGEYTITALSLAGSAT